MTTSEKSHQGWEPSMETPEQKREALEAAFDYRGDVTLTLADGSELKGFVFNRNFKTEEPYVEFLPQDEDSKKEIPLANIQGCSFTGKDAAAGKSFEAWMKKYKAKRAKQLGKK